MNCQKGDLAVVVHCDRCENLGALVEVVDGPESCILGAGWYCHSVGSPLHCVNVWENNPVLSTHFFCPDAWLRPIRPDERDVVETRELELAR